MVVRPAQYDTARMLTILRAPLGAIQELGFFGGEPDVLNDQGREAADCRVGDVQCRAGAEILEAHALGLPVLGAHGGDRDQSAG